MGETVNTIERTTGNAFSRDEEYNEFLGKPYSAVIYDWSRRCWVRCTMQSPKTPKDKIQPDPEAALVEENWGVDDPRYLLAWEGTKHAREQRDSDLLDKTILYMSVNGPKTALQLANMLEVHVSRMYRILRRNTDIFVFYRDKGARWALIGQECEKPPTVLETTKLMLKIQTLLQTYGPMIASDIAKHCKGDLSSTVRETLNRRGDWFCVVGIEPPQGMRHAAKIWGLTGIHDKEAA